MAKVENIFVWDNFLKQETFNELLRRSEFVPWKYCEVVSESAGHPVERFMTWNIYEEGEVHFDPMNIMPILDEECRPKILEKLPNATVHDMKRLRFNGTMRGEGYVMWPHADIHSNQTSVWTIVLYLEGDGGTTFYDKQDGNKIKTVEFAPNRAVMFPSRYWHRAESPKETYFRKSIGLCYMVDS